MLDNDLAPNLVFDTTKTPIVSEIAKSFTSFLGLPTVSSGFGRKGDIYQWRNITEEKKTYLLQIMPPTDIIPEIIRSIAISTNISNAAILFDRAFGEWFIEIMSVCKQVNILGARNHCFVNGA